jgi:hypothetical protein
MDTIKIVDDITCALPERFAAVPHSDNSEHRHTLRNCSGGGALR